MLEIIKHEEHSAAVNMPDKCLQYRLPAYLPYIERLCYGSKNKRAFGEWREVHKNHSSRKSTAHVDHGLQRYSRFPRAACARNRYQRNVAISHETTELRDLGITPNQ